MLLRCSMLPGAASSQPAITQRKVASGYDNLCSLLEEHPSSALVVSICSWMSERSLPCFIY